ncbi:MAG: AbrB/MazE/SpoVT family DNA-binding domain-containing protein [Acidobacteria bacterium]|nr:AbrB/MazE/SpoVT family DNA-binding domain-containing protein [Acidobacteriota bacterium]
MRITTKGQVTIPQAFRVALGLLPQSEVEFELDGDSVRIRKARKSTSRGAAVIARMKGTATSRLTTDQIMKLTRA